ncbi:hypothetical protein CKO25_10565 [Thiocapsa imhoffii]|uniref:Glycosyltransferase n=1 Tax=Thiocapsa imhoffii TaxID=382777 RepID=A0A9X0WHZ6_9GAMM|nr:glycosyltransferase [Thiocapsa imhoffii]MBK1645087.1 hypothetical protein [Thiocapsa imhoffii]
MMDKKSWRLRITLIHASDFGGGAERSVVTLHRALQALGHVSTLFVGRRQTDERGGVEIPYRRGVPGMRRLARTLEQRFGWQDIYNPSFRNLVRLIPPNTDVVHFHSLWGSNGFADLGALPAITARWPGVVTMRENWLVTGHCACFHDCDRWRTGCGRCPNLSLAPPIPRDGTAFNWRRKRSLIGRSRLRVVAISDWLKEVALASPILSGKTVTRIYNGIDLETFSPLEHHQRTELRQTLGIPADRVAVLLAGQTVEGIREGIATHHAVAALNQLTPGTVLPVVVGHSADRVAGQLRTEAIVLPFQRTPAEMARCFQGADLCLVTSEVEAFGRIGAESQACGTPVVAMGACAIPEVVRDGVGGILARVGDAATLAAAIERLARDPAERSRLGTQGREYVETHFDQRSIASRYVDLYREVLATGS